MITTLRQRPKLLLAGLVPLAIILILLRVLRADPSQLEARMGDLVEAVYGIGTITSRHTYQLKLGVTDTLLKLHVTEGDTVKRGSPLVTFADNRTFYAPFGGIVTSLPFDEGETVFPQVPVLSLIDMKDPYVVVTLEQNAAIRVRKDMEALLSFESLRGQRLTGKVTSVYPKEGQFFLNIEVAELPSGLLAGMTADVAVQVAVRKGVLQVPLAAVDRGKVRAVKGGAKRTLPVKLGATDGLWAEVLEGDLKPGDKLLVNGKKK